MFRTPGTLNDEVFITYSDKGREHISVSYQFLDRSKFFVIVDFISEVAYNATKVDYKTRIGKKKDIFITDEIAMKHILVKAIDFYLKGIIINV